jgi:hypothetical protein
MVNYFDTLYAGSIVGHPLLFQLLAFGILWCDRTVVWWQS